MNKERIDGVISNIKEAGLDYLLISEPSSIDYLIDYINNPGERMYVLMLGTKGDHKLFFNKLFFVDRDLGIDIVWHSDVDDATQTIVDNLMRCDNPYVCPHGRPTIIHYSAYELEKLFKRVV